MEEVASAETLIAWLHWDPEGIAFRIPVIDHPVRWYGILFVTGIILSYYIMVRLFSWKLQFTTPFIEEDVKDWQQLLTELKEGISGGQFEAVKDISSHFKARSRSALEAWNPGQEPSAKLKRVVIAALNEAVSQDSEFSHNRALVEELLPTSLRTTREQASVLVDRLTVYAVLGIVIGARLGHMLFYEFSKLLADPLSFFRVWEGGLASHGGALGVIVALILFFRKSRQEYPTLGLLNLLDYTAVCAGLTGAFIRLGNFVNQEILGRVTTVPWAVIFGHPADGTVPTPRHPVQLYEAAFYVLTFALLLGMWLRKGGKLIPGRLFGLFLILCFSFRFFIEFWKTAQAESFSEGSFLLMGQYLSIPFVLIGFYYYLRKKTLIRETDFS